MADQKKPRFIQITTALSPEDIGSGENLYALDEDGTVWWYDFTRFSTNLPPWRPLKMDRDDVPETPKPEVAR